MARSWSFELLARTCPTCPRTPWWSRIRAAADAVGLVFGRHVTAALNGDQITPDGTTPLAAGDTVSFTSAEAGG